MFALTVAEAKTMAMAVVGGLVVLALVAAWVVKEVTKKIATAAILGLLALLVWTQRSALDECADKVREGGIRGDTTCAFFGQDIRVSLDRTG